MATAYGILGDPDKRRRYDAGGYASLEKASGFQPYNLHVFSATHRTNPCHGAPQSDLEVEVDLSSLGTFNTALAAMFSKLGVPIKTAVAPQVRVTCARELTETQPYSHSLETAY